MHEAEHFRRRALERHRPDIGIALVLQFDGGFVRLDDGIGVGWAHGVEHLEVERLVRRRLDIVQPRQGDGMREKIKRGSKAETGDEDRGKGLARAGLAAEPDAHDGEDGDADGEEQSADRHGHQIHRRRGGQRRKAVQEHRENHELDEEQRHSARPSGFARLLDGVTRGRIARHREAQVAALISS